MHIDNIIPVPLIVSTSEKARDGGDVFIVEAAQRRRWKASRTHDVEIIFGIGINPLHPITATDLDILVQGVVRRRDPVRWLFVS